MGREVEELEMRAKFWLKPEAKIQNVKNRRKYENNNKTHPKETRWEGD
jgi:hypothetical protein